MMSHESCRSSKLFKEEVLAKKKLFKEERSRAIHMNDTRGA